MVAGFADNRNPHSLASRMRLKRHTQFRDAILKLPRPLSILDVGGTEDIWKSIGFVDQPDIDITLLNIDAKISLHHNIICVVGDARDMKVFRSGQFDVVYSNSVIEHVGELADMQKMAEEMRRVGKRYYVQTPYRYFPIEPHFLFPFFQFLPVTWRVGLLRHFHLGWIGREPDRRRAESIVRSVRLLSRREFQRLLPEAVISTEKFFGLPKSLLAWKL